MTDERQAKIDAHLAEWCNAVRTANSDGREFYPVPSASLHGGLSSAGYTLLVSDGNRVSDVSYAMAKFITAFDHLSPDELDRWASALAEKSKMLREGGHRDLATFRAETGSIR